MKPELDPARLEELLPLGTPVYHVLLGLGRGTLHGYAIMQSFDGLFGSDGGLLPGTLYATLARMLETGLVEEVPAPDEGADARRRYYRATEYGLALAGAETERLRRLVGVAETQSIVPGRAR